MITSPKQPLGYLASSWVGGVTLVMLLAGVYGAAQPLLPRTDDRPVKMDLGNEVLLEQFTPPSAAAEENPPETPPAEQPDIEIPPLPVVMAPLTPPEMVELTPLEEPPPPAPPTPPAPKDKPQTEPRRAASAPPGTGEPKGGTAGGSGAVTTFTGGGGGRFPSPGYPAAARASREQGTVRLLVTVEATGLPSSVTVQSSSGSAALDSAARDHISRRWRWPAGEIRRYIVPVRFVLQP
jgi:periplasmic protein TonB